jgi:hypothetical protein
MSALPLIRTLHGANKSGFGCQFMSTRPGNDRRTGKPPRQETGAVASNQSYEPRPAAEYNRVPHLAGLADTGLNHTSRTRSTNPEAASMSLHSPYNRRRRRKHLTASSRSPGAHTSDMRLLIGGAPFREPTTKAALAEAALLVGSPGTMHLPAHCDRFSPTSLAKCPDRRRFRTLPVVCLGCEITT